MALYWISCNEQFHWSRTFNIPGFASSNLENIKKIQCKYFLDQTAFSFTEFKSKNEYKLNKRVTQKNPNISTPYQRAFIKGKKVKSN